MGVHAFCILCIKNQCGGAVTDKDIQVLRLNMRCANTQSAAATGRWNIPYQPFPNAKQLKYAIHCNCTGAIWSKAVIAATLATALLLPLAGVPLLGPGGSLYRAMGVLTAGSPCALVLVPLAYVCALAAATSRCAETGIFF